MADFDFVPFDVLSHLCAASTGVSNPSPTAVGRWARSQGYEWRRVFHGGVSSRVYYMPDSASPAPSEGFSGGGVASPTAEVVEGLYGASGGASGPSCALLSMVPALCDSIDSLVVSLQGVAGVLRGLAGAGAASCVCANDITENYLPTPHTEGRRGAQRGGVNGDGSVTLLEVFPSLRARFRGWAGEYVEGLRRTLGVEACDSGAGSSLSDPKTGVGSKGQKASKETKEKRTVKESKENKERKENPNDSVTRDKGVICLGSTEYMVSSKVSFYKLTPEQSKLPSFASAHYGNLIVLPSRGNPTLAYARVVLLEYSWKYYREFRGVGSDKLGYIVYKPEGIVRNTPSNTPENSAKPEPKYPQVRARKAAEGNHPADGGETVRCEAGAERRGEAGYAVNQAPEGGGKAQRGAEEPGKDGQSSSQSEDGTRKDMQVHTQDGGRSEDGTRKDKDENQDVQRIPSGKAEEAVEGSEWEQMTDAELRAVDSEGLDDEEYEGWRAEYERRFGRIAGFDGTLEVVELDNAGVWAREHARCEELEDRPYYAAQDVERMARDVEYAAGEPHRLLVYALYDTMRLWYEADEVTDEDGNVVEGPEYDAEGKIIDYDEFRQRIVPDSWKAAGEWMQDGRIEMGDGSAVEVAKGEMPRLSEFFDMLHWPVISYSNRKGYLVCRGRIRNFDLSLREMGVKGKASGYQEDMDFQRRLWKAGRKDRERLSVFEGMAFDVMECFMGMDKDGNPQEKDGKVFGERQTLALRVGWRKEGLDEEDVRLVMVGNPLRGGVLTMQRRMFSESAVRYWNAKRSMQSGVPQE